MPSVVIYDNCGTVEDFIMVGRKRGLGENIGHHGCPTTKKLNQKRWLKCPETLSKNDIWTKK